MEMTTHSNETNVGTQSVLTGPSPATRDAFTKQFTNAMKKGVQGIIDAGQVLINAKSELGHGHFTNWVTNELKYGNMRSAEMQMQLARHNVISNPSHWHAFPPSVRTLHVITQIRPAERLIELTKEGKVYSGMTREEAMTLRAHEEKSAHRKYKGSKRSAAGAGRSNADNDSNNNRPIHKSGRAKAKPQLKKLKKELAILLDVCLHLSDGADVVLAHIREMKRVNTNVTVEAFDKASRWAKAELAKQAAGVAK
jgi:hypothetical protein